MTIKPDLRMLGIALLGAWLAALVVGAGEDVHAPTVVLFWGFVLTTLVGAWAIGVERIRALHSISLHSTNLNGKQYLFVQMGEHFVLVDPANNTEPVLTLSPSRSESPRALHGTECKASNVGFETLTAPHPPIETLSEEDFHHLFFGDSKGGPQ